MEKSVHQCPTCGKQLEPSARYCPDDGTPVTSDVRTATGKTVTEKIPLQLPLIVGNRYKLTELRGGGGMAKVYRAVDETLGREVAVKVINLEFRADPEF